MFKILIKRPATRPLQTKSPIWYDIYQQVTSSSHPSKYISQRSSITITSFLGWIYGKKALKTFGLDLLEEYAFPQPMPEDKFYDYHVDTNQAYLMLATEGTGI